MGVIRVTGPNRHHVKDNNNQQHTHAPASIMSYHAYCLHPLHPPSTETLQGGELNTAERPSSSPNLLKLSPTHMEE